MSDDELIAAICAEFRRDWESESRPSIAVKIVENPQLDSSNLARALVPIEIQMLHSRGETLRASKYAQFGNDIVNLAMECQKKLGGLSFAIEQDMTTGFSAGDPDGEVDGMHSRGDHPTRFSIPSEESTFVEGRHGNQPRWIDRYRLIKEIGAGGMGSVWKAEQIEPVKRLVALKVVRADVNSKDAIERFEVERQAIALMEHQNIAKILDAGETESGNPFFAMELVDGTPLNRYCDKNKLSVRERLELMIPVCRAVQHAHQKGIIHRDLKHSNVLVTEVDGNPIPKVIDFGLAKALGHQGQLTDSTKITEVGKVVGTLHYMSPEQASTSKIDVDTRSDVYSLGVMLYKLLVGTTPLQSQNTEANESWFDTLQMIRDKDPNLPSAQLQTGPKDLHAISRLRNSTPDKLQQTVSGELDWIVMRALEKDRNDRYQTASDLALELERYLNDQPVLAGPRTALYSFKKFVKRNQSFVAALGLIATVLIAGIIATTASAIWALSERTRANKKTVIAQEETANARMAEQMQKELQNAAHIDLQALRTKSSWSAWQLGNVEEAYRLLSSTEKSLSGWEYDFLSTEFESTKATLYGNSMAIADLDVSSDGAFFLSAGTDHTIRLWDAKTRKQVYRKVTEAEPTCVAFSNDSETFYLADESKKLSIFSTQTGDVVKTYDRFESIVTCIEILPGDRIAIGLSDSDEENEIDGAELLIFDLKQGKPVQKLSGHSKKITSIIANKEATQLVSSSHDGTIRIWNKDREFAQFRVLQRHASPVNGLAMAPNAEEFVSCGDDGTVRRWKLETGEQIQLISAHRRPIQSVAYSPEGERILSSSADRTAAIWNLEGKKIRECIGHFEALTKCKFSKDGKSVLTGSTDRTIRLWDASEKSATISVKPHHEEVWSGSISLDGKRLATGSEDGTVAIMDIDTGKPVCEKLEHNGPVLSVKYSPDGKWLVAAGAFVLDKEAESDDFNFALNIYDAKTGKFVKSLGVHDHNVWDVSFSKDGRFCATASADKSVRIWDPSDWTLVDKLTKFDGEVASARFSPDSTLLVAASDDFKVRLFDTTDFELLHTYDGHEHGVWRAIFSPDGQTIASSGFDGKIFFWGVAEGERKAISEPMKAHSDQIAGLTYSPMGNRLVSGSDDRSIRFWDPESRVEFLSLRDTDDDQIIFVAFSQDSKKLISGSGKGRVTIRTALTDNVEFDAFLPSNAIEIEVQSLTYVLDRNATKEVLNRERKKLMKCWKRFPSFESLTNLGIVDYRLGNYLKAVEWLEEARRLEPIEYGEPDVVPYAEGFLAMAYKKAGDLEKANEIRKLFEDKRRMDLWFDDFRVVEMQKEIVETFAQTQ